MTPAKFAAYIRYKTRTNSTTLTDTNLLLLANLIKDEMCAELVDVNEDLFVMRYYRDLVAGQRAYALPAEMLTKIKYVQAILDGTEALYLDEFDINSYKRPLDETNTRLNFANRRPAYDLNAGALNIYSGEAIINVTNGLIVHATQLPADLSSLAGTTEMSVDPSTTEFGIPRQMQKAWANRVVIEYKSSKDKPIPLTESEKKWDFDWQTVKDSMKAMNLSRETVPTVPCETGENY